MGRVSFYTSAEGGLVLDLVLSERNLWTLLTKLYTPGSACEIWVGDHPPEVAVARLRAEPDALHYSSPTRKLGQGLAGAMHPVTEAVVARVRPLIEKAVSEALGIDGGGSKQ